ncbi:hypothetical protein BO83DRAFT_374919 [Aspergillus eucalypticola CBS 122712]|uniref:Uncharacterized protein n=1 Tax=Aspergillus eucalypticola (strain CBS 122712 / IBT 29274) TaxID=1448314 RepID=A0A317W714_ASPEC|nr:uncharacterized protein BO83DRAFT_374919 [Aspergillus eucalypticola CBS 122712]PWY82434.1 hypothetical protein BO83DRAFT_374919 [Aspergillus eucalypticola CBS 122712]
MSATQIDEMGVDRRAPTASEHRELGPHTPNCPGTGCLTCNGLQVRVESRRQLPGLQGTVP